MSSTSRRLACAIAAFAVALPAAAAAGATRGGADASVAVVGGGSVYGSVGGSAYGSAGSRSVLKQPTSAAIRHLGDRLPVRQGMRGRDVKILQDFFNRVGIKVAIDGSFGQATSQALRRFEKRTSQTVDGVLRKTDLTKLIEVLNNGGFDDLLPPPTTVAFEPGPTERATLNPDGTATAPASAPPEVHAIVAAANEIATKPYKYGGGHGDWNDSGYDCSGSVSYALHGADLLKVPRDSSELETFGKPGKGQWVTVYGKASHAYMVVAGLRFDTSGRSKGGSRWQADHRSSSSYVVRHPAGL